MNIFLKILLFLQLFTSISLAQFDWEWQYSTTTEDLNDVHFINHDKGLAVGNNGIIINTTDGGKTWYQRDSRVNQKLRKIQYLNEDLGWVVGDQVMLFTEDGGLSWSKYSQTFILDIYCLFFIDERNGWVCGSDNIILKTDNGGASWEAIPSRVGNFDDIFFLNEQLGWFHSRDDAGHIYMTEDGGQTLISMSRSRKSFKSFFFIDSKRGWACGGLVGKFNNLFGWLDISTDSGDNWAWQYENELMHSLHFFDEYHGIALGQKNRDPTSDKTYEVFLKTGYSWASSEPGGNAFHFVDKNTGWIVGYRGKIYKTTTSGGILNFPSVTGKITGEFKLLQNYPNPFNPSAIINYELPITNDVELTIYNLLGEEVAVLVSERQSPGNYQTEWNASGFAGGIYYYTLKAGEFQQVKKMILLR
jgi:photosystem II stability/assembly factor-like uncharacterized protein